MVPATLLERLGLGKTVDELMPAPGSSRVLGAALQGRDRVTLDIDASAVHAKKKTARSACKGRKGYMPMIGHIAETGQVVKSEPRKGSVPPAAKNREFFERCIEALPEGARAARLRADAASCQASLINACRRHGTRFAIRAKADPSVRAAIAAIPQEAWQPMPLDDVSFSETESVARTVHAMAGTPEAFCLTMQRKAVDRPG